MSDVPHIETERLTLRPWRADDFPAFARFHGDEHTARYIGGVASADDAWRRMAAIVGHWALRGYGVWAIEEKASRQFAGYSGHWFPHGFPEPEILWSVMPEFQGKGFATEAARAALKHAYTELGWTTAMSLIAPENTASQRVAGRLGAKLERTTEIRGMKAGIFRHQSPTELKTSNT